MPGEGLSMVQWWMRYWSTFLIGMVMSGTWVPR